MQRFILITVTVALASIGWSQDHPALTARELFYTPPPETPPKPSAVSAQPPAKPPEVKFSKKETPGAKKSPAAVTVATTPPTRMPLGLRYTVLKRNSAGDYTEVDPESSFQSGDRIRIQVEANTTGYLYVVTQGSSGAWKPLFPAADVANGSNVIHRGDSRAIPSSGQFLFDQRAGTERLFLVLARQPEADLDKFLYVLGKPEDPSAAPPHLLVASASVGDEVVDHLRKQVSIRDLVFENVDNAAYVVNTSASADARLVVDIALKHQ